MKTPVRLNSECIKCLLSKYLDNLPEAASEEVRLEYSKRLIKILYDATLETSSPELASQIYALQEELLGIDPDYTDIKKHFNALILSMEEELLSAIEAAKDPLYLALCYSMLGNYVDFGTVNVDEEKLKEMLSRAHTLEFDNTEYYNLKKDLSQAKKLIYLTDNCGEIALDKLFIIQLLKEFPHLKAEVIVRGEPVLNDATCEDALQIGLDAILPVSHNGSHIAGTCLNRISNEARRKLEEADVIISKGQGNFETLSYCNKNVYYIFMCKCSMFAKRFGVPLYSGMLLNDFRMKK